MSAVLFSVACATMVRPMQIDWFPLALLNTIRGFTETSDDAEVSEQPPERVRRLNQVVVVSDGDV